ncbi:hydroxymethylbilane synthase [Francisella frigiditurris]|uniref:Porphobilinogen deaminase n=1 Tax=Francisella frigiditurris TaxID=1542390 RepID=A0A1J0KTP2_9GAMM|nr:hydroxymethylbilane synthase [Francisella frigiditurris]APC97022.1 hydroxymethylbilane synthase [Francisella frigiditurris]
MKKIILASRESLLALWQTNFAKAEIEKHLSIECEILTMKTQGDIILDKPLNKIGGKALFMKELEVAIKEGKADIAVHSLKDIPYDLPVGFCLATFFKREDPRDAFVSNTYGSIDELPNGAVIGTSSLRRKSQLLNYRPDLRVKDLRGNVQTRLGKLDQGMYDAIILASAGLIRLNLKDRITQYISKEICLPAVGQGVVAIELLEKNESLKTALNKLTCENTYKSIAAERAFNKELKGGCHVAIAAHATIEKEKIFLEAVVASSDGKDLLRKSALGIDPVKLGKELAQEMISLGAYKILER